MSECSECVPRRRRGALCSAYSNSRLLCSLSPDSETKDLPTGVIAPVGAVEEEGFESVEDAPVLVAPGELQQPDKGEIIDAEEDLVIQEAQSLPEPHVPTKSEIAAHNVTHLPYRSWCPHCVAARRPNTGHRSSASSSTNALPLIVADYCYIRDIKDEALATVLVAELYPSQALFACI